MRRWREWWQNWRTRKDPLPPDFDNMVEWYRYHGFKNKAPRPCPPPPYGDER